MQQEEEEAIQDQIARDQDAAIQEEHDRLILGTFIDKPLTLVGPDKKVSPIYMNYICKQWDFFDWELFGFA